MYLLTLFGFQGCGKTHFGTLVSKSLGWNFIDTDQLIEQKVGATCRLFYEQYGEAAFRNVESEVIQGIKIEDKVVVALGGGSLLNPLHRDLIAHWGGSVYLKCSPQVLRARWTRKNHSFDTLFATYLPIYESIKSHCIELDHKHETEVLWELIHLATSSE